MLTRALSLSILLTVLVLTSSRAPGLGDAPARSAVATLRVDATKAAIASLTAPVTIDYDAVDIPTIRAQSLDDAVRAEGWAHARERFLQMDLARRQAAGELGAIFPQAIASDRAMRPFLLRAVAQRALAQLKPAHRVMLERYAEGVNAQIASDTPLEYRMLHAQPEVWKPEDTLLVQLGMARYLDSSNAFDGARAGLLRAVASAEVAQFLMSSAGVLSMSVDGSPLPTPPALPTAAQLDLRNKARRGAATATDHSKELTPGSNAFAIAASRTRDGRAIVGNDMHLALTAPGIWYRISMEWPEGRLLGLSLPGVPLIAQGTNGHIAWAFTNLTADLSDLVLIERDPKDPTRYLVPGGSEPFTTETVQIGKAPRDESLTITSTRFGPIVAEQPDGNPIALRWVFLEPGALDVGLFDLAASTTIDGALHAARDWHGPPQNILIASDDGHIGWTIAGSLPARSVATPAPVSWRTAPTWNGVLASDAKPIVRDPTSGILTSANQLSITPSGALASVLGTDEVSGDRARRMRDLLATRSDWTEAMLHAEVQLDTYSARLVRWRDAMMAALSAPIADEAATAALSILRTWNGRVDAEMSAPVILDAFRSAMREVVGGAVGVNASQGLEDEAVLRMFESRAPQFVPAPYSDWTEFSASMLVQSATRSLLPKADPSTSAPRERTSARTGDEPDASLPADSTVLASAIQFKTRGSVNVCSIRHPAADSLGPAARLAEMPRAELPGHPTCIRVQTPSFGASERSVISPAHLADAVLVTPCGQASMPTSPHFRSLHSFWQKGEPYPLLPGSAARRVELTRELPKDEVIVPARSGGVAPVR